MKTKIIIESLKNDSSKNIIHKLLLEFAGIYNINIDKSEVSFNYKSHNVLEGLREKLYQNGFTITTDPNIIEY